MLPEATMKEIFKSIPKTLSSLDIHVEYADRVNVSEQLEKNDIVVTIGEFADRSEGTPGNKLLGVDKSGTDIKYMRGEYWQENINLNVHVKDKTDKKAEDVIRPYMDLLKVWAVRDLPEIVEVAGEARVTDLSYLEDHSRRGFEVPVRYTVSYDETVATIDSEEISLNT